MWLSQLRPLAGRSVFLAVLAVGWLCSESCSGSPPSGIPHPIKTVGESATAKWPQFRGEGGRGIASSGGFPVLFSPETNCLWKVELPQGQSSPCIWEKRLFITGSKDDSFKTLCLDSLTGEVLWQSEVDLAEGERGSGLGGPAAPTCCTDGQRVYSYSGPFGLVAYSMEGEEVWRRPLPTPATGHGVGTSPIVAGRYLVLLRDQDLDSEILALDCETGRTIWAVPRPEFRRGFCTPVVLQQGHSSLVLAPGTLQAVAYDLDSGREAWRVPGLPNEICTSPVVAHGVLLLGGWTPGSGFRSMPAFDDLILRGDSDGDGMLTRQEAPSGPARQHFHYIDANRDGVVSREEYEFIADAFTRSSNVMLAMELSEDSRSAPIERWKQTRGLPYVPTPLVYGGRVYLVKNGGMVTCVDLQTGAVLYREERLDVLGDNYASPVAADGKIAIASRSGTVAVLRDGQVLDVLARNDIGESIMATPAIAQDILYVRTENHLWAFRESSAAQR